LQKKKEEEEARKAELALLYKPTQKAPAGVDPKSLLCEFFKAGSCTKGAKCKFSHDLAIERKAAKIDIYTDTRDEDKKEDTMDKWDQIKLEQVVSSKSVGTKPKSDIICKYFLDALEKDQYGWFWDCANGDSCHYRHALPPGFVLKRDVKKKSDEDDSTLEEYIEHERGKITGALTLVTEETFTEWKKKRMEKKRNEEEEKKKAKEAAIKAGKSLSLSGRDLFTYRPDLFVDDEEAFEGDIYENRDEEQSDDDEPQSYGIIDATDEDDEDNEEDLTNGGEGSSKLKGDFGALEEDVFGEEDLDNLDIEDDDDNNDQENAEDDENEEGGEDENEEKEK